MQNFNFMSKYSHYKPELMRKENWEESIERIYSMHKVYYKTRMSSELTSLIAGAQDAEQRRVILSSQRVRQFAGAGILKNNSKLYNCASSYADRVEFFPQIMWVLLGGVGAGFSVQKKHIRKLPEVVPVCDETKFHYTIEDTIEGWSHATGYLVNSYLYDPTSQYHEAYGKKVIFNYSLIRPEGALIAGQFKAPGPEGLRYSIEKCRNLLIEACSNGKRKLRSIEVYDLVMWIADAVLSGGVRRSATICLFSLGDREMMNAKTGNWFHENPQRRLSNNSVVVIKGKATKNEFLEVFQAVREFGEPGFVLTPNEDITYNPCVEIGKRPQTVKGKSGWQFCNLTEGNGGYCDTKEKFFEMCKWLSVVGTLQAGYDNFSFLGDVTEEIVRREALLGCSITGWMMNPEILFDEETLREGARVVKKWNGIVADLIGINHAARTTCSKPAGNSSILLGTSSGIGGDHSKRYIRNIQVNKEEILGQAYAAINPFSVEQSVWKTTDNVVSFAVKSNGKAIYKKDLIGVNQLEYIKKAQMWWVEEGTNESLCVDPETRHNISNTVQVGPEDWDDVANYIWKNRKYFAGISLLSTSGDIDYPQAPFSEVLSPNELVKRYGSGSILASGLIVDGLKAFNGNLWMACDYASGTLELDDINRDSILQYIGKYIDPLTNNFEYMLEGVMVTDINAVIDHLTHLNNLKFDWIQRFRKFAKNYMEGDLKKTTYCLKHTNLWWKWCKLANETTEMVWDDVDFSEDYIKNAADNAAVACAGGACEI